MRGKSEEVPRRHDSRQEKVILMIVTLRKFKPAYTLWGIREARDEKMTHQRLSCFQLTHLQISVVKNQKSMSEKMYRECCDLMKDIRIRTALLDLLFCKIYE